MLLGKKSTLSIGKYYKSYARFASTDLSMWKPRIGLEIHAQIDTKSKLFSGAEVNFNSTVNLCVSLFDCAIPGTMPVLNRKCVEAGVLTALALSCDINAVSMFERKHYFYSDLPAGFQITQQKKPLAVNGKFEYLVYHPELKIDGYLKSSKLKQLQLEQDSGKSFHSEQSNRNFVDLNRAGVPLMELVFEPDLSSGEEAASLVRELSVILKLIGTCSCKMEEGALRVDANVSVSRDNEPWGTRTEIKNIGSIRAINNAIEYEIQRQISILSSGSHIRNQTLNWDPLKKETVLMREKEDKHDYRFMPETNLPPLCLHVDENVENKHNLIEVTTLKKQLTILPGELRENLLNKLKPHTAVAITSDLELFALFRKIVENRKHFEPQFVAQIVITEISGFLERHKLDTKYCDDNLSYIEESMDLLQLKKISYQTFKDLLDYSIDDPLKKGPTEVVAEKNWFIVADGEDLEQLCLELLKQNPKLVAKYKKKQSKRVFRVLLNNVATVTEGRADMAKVTKILTRLLK